MVAKMFLTISGVSDSFHALNKKLMFSPAFKIIKCKQCGYGYYNRYITPESIKQYYEEEYWNSEGLPREQWKDIELFLNDIRAQGQYQCIKPILKRSSVFNVLEVGAGAALFSRYLKNKYEQDVNLHVVEPGNGWQEYYQELEINRVAGFFPFESKQKFDYIHTSHWLEHVLDLDQTLKELKKLLNCKAYLFIEVPNCNEEYFSSNISDTPHIHFFTKQSLQKLLEKYGFNTITIGEYGITNSEEHMRRTINPQVIENKRDEIRESLSGNVNRDGGSCIRGLFQLV